MNNTSKTLSAVRDSLLEAVDAVERLTAAKVALYDVGAYLRHTGLAALLPVKLLHHHCAYCSYVRSLPGGRVKCIHCDKSELIERVQREEKQFVRQCYAGLTEMVIPLRLRRRLFAVAYLGQARAPGTEENADKALEELGCDQTCAAKLFSALPMVSTQVLEAGGHLLKPAIENCIGLLPDEMISEVFLDSDFLISKQVEAIIASRPDNTYSVKDLADTLFMLPEALSRLYRKETGHSLKSRLDSTSYSLARRLLSEGQDTASVSANLGFTDDGDFCRWLRRHARRKTDRPDTKDAIVKQYTRRAQDYLNGHFREKIRVDTLAQMMGITPDHLNRVFKKQTGQTITETLWKLRINSAKRELEQTQLSLGTIASHNGFGTKKAFGERFLATCGITPEEFRKRQR